MQPSRRGPTTAPSAACPASCFNAGPSRRGPGLNPGDSVEWQKGQLQCGALSSRAGARGSRRLPRWRLGFNAGPSRRGPGRPRRSRGSARTAATFNAGPSRRGPGRRATGVGPGRGRRASMQGPLVEGRGARGRGPLAHLVAASMQGPLVEGRGSRCPRAWRTASSPCFNAGPSRRGPGPLGPVEDP